LNRFNPDALSRDVYEEIEYNKNQIIPSLNRPNEFKTNTKISKSIRVRLKKKPIVYNAYIITFDIDGEKKYFYNWSTDLNDVDRYIQWTDEPDFESTPSAVDARSAKYFQSESAASQDYQSVVSFINNADILVSATGTIGAVTGTGPWTATMTGITSTTPFGVGSYIAATDGTGKLFGGTPESVKVSQVINSTSIKYIVTGGTAPVPGTVTGIYRTNVIEVEGNTVNIGFVSTEGVSATS
jgi:hypothetical protein